MVDAENKVSSKRHQWTWDQCCCGSYLPVDCSRFQPWMSSRTVLLCWGRSLNIRPTSADRPLPTDTSSTRPSLLKKKTGSKAVLKNGRQTSSGWYVTATSVKLGEIFLTCQPSWRAELCYCSQAQCWIVGSQSHLVNFRNMFRKMMQKWLYATVT